MALFRLGRHGEALTGLGRHDEALAACEQALALRPEWGRAEVGRRAVLERLDRKE
jgi:hypothetical protein